MSESTEKAKATGKERILRLPRFYRIASLVIILFPLPLLAVYLLIFQFEDWPYLFIMGFLELLFIIMFASFSLWQVEVSADGFQYRNWIGKRVEYKYIELEYKAHPRGLKWFFYKDGKKVFCMPYYIENGDILWKLHDKAIKRKDT